MHLPGKASPLGSTIAQGEVNFSVYSSHATAVELLFFDRLDNWKLSRKL